MQIDIKKLVPEASIPKNATPLDTGYDLIALDNGTVVGDPLNERTGLWKRIDYIEYKTGIQISPRDKIDGRQLGGPKITLAHYFTLLFPRSSVSKYNLLLANSVGLVDNPYRGEILLRFKYIWQPEDYHFFGMIHSLQMFGSPNQGKCYRKGDKIAQIAAFELNPIQWNEVDNLDETKRGEGGFGSSGA